MEQPKTQYARNGDVNIAYQVLGDGPIDLVVLPGFISHLDLWWTLPEVTAFMRRLASFSRLILFDKRGTGLSDPVASPPALEERVDDLRAVLEAVGSARAHLLGISEGGPTSVLFAASHPDRVASLVLYGTAASGSPRSAGHEIEARMAELTALVDDHWGEGLAVEWFVPNLAGSPTLRRTWGLFERAAASPAMVSALIRSYREIDVTDVLPAIRVPTLVLHRVGDCAVPVEAARAMADRIPGARYVELAGDDHIPWVGDPDRVLDEIEEFLTGSRHAPQPDRVLATVMFTDIVGSTARATELGDRRWTQLLEAHHELVRTKLERHKGREIDTAGDGFLAAFDGPAAAIGCACSIRDSVQEIGLQIRAGIHTGECEASDRSLRGVAVHIGARVLGLANPGEVLVSSTVKDLVVGSGTHFADRGRHRLKGLPEEWRLFAVADQRPVDTPLAARGDDIAPNAETRRRGDRVMLRLARRAPGAMRLASRAAQRRVDRELAT